MKSQVTIGVCDAADSAERFVKAWRHAESGQEIEVENRLYFENLETLLKTLTAQRWALLRKLRTSGLLSVQSLANKMGRSCKDVETDVQQLEIVGLISRSKENKIEVPWDIVEAKLRLAA